MSENPLRLAETHASEPHEDLDNRPTSVEEFEEQYAERMGVTVADLHDLGYHAEEHDCDDFECATGMCSTFHMVEPPAPEPEPYVPDSELIVHE